MNRFFEFTPVQLKVVLLLTLTLIILALVSFIRDYSSVEDENFVFSVNLTEPDSRYIPPIKVDLNRSPADSLELLPGIGPTLAGRIVHYRDSVRFEAVEDIMKVNGIGYKTFKIIQSYIEVGEW